MPRSLLHLGFWLVYLMLNSYVEVALAGNSFKDYPLWHQIGIGVMVEFLLLPIKVVVTYLVLYRLLPDFFRHRRWLPSLGLVGLSVVIAAFINLLMLYQVVYPFIYGEAGTWSYYTAGRFFWAFIDISSVVGLASAFKFFRLRLNSLEKEKALVEEKLEAELRFLRAQTNPHFLFNVLNTIYALARKKDDRTEEVVLRLSKLLRFMIYECSAALIPLERERQLIQDYLALEQLRFPKRLQLVYEEKMDDSNCMLPPLLLLPLVENAFKHGVDESRFGVVVDIRLQLKNKELLFRVYNTVEADDQQKLPGTGGIGLQNLQRQLNLLFPNQHQLLLEAEPGHFLAELKIDLS